jgi:hypothetical protein
MQREFGRSLTGAFAPLAILLTASMIRTASADGLPPSTATELRPAQCNETASSRATHDAVGCARIIGYVAAGSDFATVENIGRRLKPFSPLSGPIVTSAGAASEPSLPNSPPKQRSFFLRVGQDDATR